MTTLHTRMRRERMTLQAMISRYCRSHHGTEAELCAECKILQKYALERLDKCPFHEAKPTCARCPVHCYKPDMREKIRTVMRYAGPRIIRRHPILAIRHMIEERRKGPVR